MDGSRIATQEQILRIPHIPEKWNTTDVINGEMKSTRLSGEDRKGGREREGERQRGYYLLSCS